MSGLSVALVMPDGYTAAPSMGKTVGQNIATLRKARGLSQAALADRLGVRQPTIAKWENQAGDPELNTLFLLSKELDATVHDFVAGLNEKHDALVAKKSSALSPTRVIRGTSGEQNAQSDPRLLEQVEQHYRDALADIAKLAEDLLRVAHRAKTPKETGTARARRSRRVSGDRGDRK